MTTFTRLLQTVALLPLLTSLVFGALPVRAADDIPAAIKFNPPAKTWPLGGVQTVDVLLDSGSVSGGTTPLTLNAATVKLVYSPNLEFVGYSTNGSIFERGDTPTSDQFSTLTFSRSTSGGFTGSNGLLMHLQFKALDTATKYINLDLAMSSLYAYNPSTDPSATPQLNVINEVAPAFYSVQGPLNLPSLPERTVAPRTTDTVVQTYEPANPASLVALQATDIGKTNTRPWLRYLLWGTLVTGLVLGLLYYLNTRRPTVTIRTI